VALGLGGIGYYLQFESAGGVQEWLSVGRGKTNWAVVTGYMAQLEGFLPIGLLLVLLAVEFYRQRVPLSVRLVIWTLALLLWMWFLYLGTRSRLIGWTLGTGAVYYLTRRQNPPLWLAGLVFAALIPITNFQARYRHQFTNLSFHLDQLDWEEVDREVIPHFGSGARERKRAEEGFEFNCAMAVVELAGDRIPFNFGYGHLEVFTRPIPRRLWPYQNKPYPHLEAVQDVFRVGGLSLHYESGVGLLSGPALGFTGHWYLVGGPLALLVAGYLTGAMFRMIRQVYERTPFSHGDLLLYMNLFPIGFNEAAATPLYFLFSLPFQLIVVHMLFWMQRLNVTAQRFGSSRVAGPPRAG
jgi:hypothetical protein